MGREDEQAEHRGCLEQWNQSVGYYDGGYISSYMYNKTKCTRMSPRVNYRLWETVTCQCRFTDDDKGTALRGWE